MSFKNTSRYIEDPVVTAEPGPGQRDQSVTRHPSFAQIGASRVSGYTPLYDSDFKHQNYMTVTIRKSQLHRSLHRDWHFGREELIQVAMSESQWATFVSSPNMGSGVPCTMTRHGGVSIPGLPDPQARTEQFAEEMKEKLEATVQNILNTIEEVGSLGLAKGKAERLKSSLNGLVTQLRSNLPFIASQFAEHMEDTTEKAKQEIHGYMTAVVQRAGFESLANNQMPLALDYQGDGE